MDKPLYNDSKNDFLGQTNFSWRTNLHYEKGQCYRVTQPSAIFLKTGKKGLNCSMPRKNETLLQLLVKIQRE
jgi:hypothetical protein